MKLMISHRDMHAVGRPPALWPAAEQALEYLTPSIRTTLAALCEAPAGVAESVVQLMPFGSRAALAETGVVAFASANADDPSDVSGPGRITDLGYAVIELAADAASATPESVVDWTDVPAYPVPSVEHASARPGGSLRVDA
jgi:hypothetical protein